MAVGVLETEFGKARVKKGYYTITSKKEGNCNKLLHRLIFEDFYQIKLPRHIIVHHEDMNKLNNEIWNLVPMTNSEHLKIHSKNKSNGMYGRKHTKDTLKLMSKSQNNSTGFFRVNKITRNVKQGFVWAYMYYKKGEKHQTFISSVDLIKVKEKVIAKGLDWFIIDENIAKSVCKQYGYDKRSLLMSTEQRFEPVLNEFDEIDYIRDNVAMEDLDFIEFIKMVNEQFGKTEQLTKENQQLRERNAILKDSKEEKDCENQHLKEKISKIREIWEKNHDNNKEMGLILHAC